MWVYISLLKSTSSSSIETGSSPALIPLGGGGSYIVDLRGSLDSGEWRRCLTRHLGMCLCSWGLLMSLFWQLLSFAATSKFQVVLFPISSESGRVKITPKASAMVHKNHLRFLSLGGGAGRNKQVESTSGAKTYSSFFFFKLSFFPPHPILCSPFKHLPLVQVTQLIFRVKLFWCAVMESAWCWISEGRRAGTCGNRRQGKKGP